MRQNPHNVAEWLNRVELFKQKEKPHEIINTYTEAVQTVDPKQAVGKLHHLWVNFAKFYDENDQLEDARVILEKATHIAFLKVCNYDIKALTKYERPKMKRDARQKCSIFLRALVGHLNYMLHCDPQVWLY